MKGCEFVIKGGRCNIHGRDYSNYFPSCSRECKHHPEYQASNDLVSDGVKLPIVVKDVWDTGSFKVEMGVDANGVNVERREVPEFRTSDGGDTIRDAEAGKIYATGKLVWGQWEISK